MNCTTFGIGFGKMKPGQFLTVRDFVMTLGYIINIGDLTMGLKLTKVQKDLLAKVFRERISDLQREQAQAKSNGTEVSAAWYDTEIADTRQLLRDILENS